MEVKNKWLVMLAFLLLAVACGKKKDKCLKAKVIRISCTGLVVQVLNRDSVGSYGWRDISGHAVYNNVFRVSNSCKAGGWFKGDVFYFTIADALIQNDCIVCMMYDAPPGIALQIENISGKGCQ